MSGIGVTTRRVVPGEMPAGIADPGLETSGVLPSPIPEATTTTAEAVGLRVGETIARKPFRAVAHGAVGDLTTTTSAETEGAETEILEPAPVIPKEPGEIPGRMAELAIDSGTIHPTAEATETTASVEAHTTLCGMDGDTSPATARPSPGATVTKGESRRVGHPAPRRSCRFRCSTVAMMRMWARRRAPTCAKWKRGGD